MTDYIGPLMPARSGKVTKPDAREPKNHAELLAVVWGVCDPTLPETMRKCSTEAEREGVIWWFLQGSKQKEGLKAAKPEYLSRGLSRLAGILADFLAGKGPNEHVQAEVAKIQDIMDQHSDYVTK